MPLQRCSIKGKLGWKWGIHGKCYVGKNAKQKAISQALAIGKGKIPKDNIHIKQDSKESVENFKSVLKYQRIQMGANNRAKPLPKNPGQWLYPIAIERDYYKLIKSYITQFTGYIKEFIIPMLPRWINERELSDVITDKLNDLPAIEEILDNFESEFESDLQALQDMDTDIFEKNRKEIMNALFGIGFSIYLFNDKQFQKIVKNTIHVNPVLNEPWKEALLNNWVNKNVNLIRGLEQETLKDISRIIYDGYSDGLTADEIARQLNKKIKGIEGYRSKLIARDQTSKLNGLLTKKRQNEIGVETYFWVTALDERVRSKHKSLHNVLCKWSDDTVYSIDGGKTWLKRTSDMFIGIPGEDYQCRCRARPNFEPIVNEIDLEIDWGK